MFCFCGGVPDSCHSWLCQVCSFCVGASEPRYSSGLYSVQPLPISSYCDGKESTSCLAKQPSLPRTITYRALTEKNTEKYGGVAAVLGMEFLHLMLLTAAAYVFDAYLAQRLGGCYLKRLTL